MVSHCACPTKIFRNRALQSHKRRSSPPSQFSMPLLTKTAKATFHCPQGMPLILLNNSYKLARCLSRDGGLNDLPRRATFSPSHPLARQVVPLALARALQPSSHLLK